MWLIIGGSGFIGINFAKFLMKNDYNFKVYDRRRSKYLPPTVETIVGDIRDKTKLSQAMKDCEIVFHLATVPPSLRLPSYEIYDIDVNGTRNVLAAAERNNINKVIFASSASHVYGLIDKDLCPIREDCNLNPINEYGKNKVMAEELCKKAAENNKLKTIVLRLSMVLGPYNLDPILVENVVSLFKNKRVIIAGDGSGKAQSIHVQDVNTAFLACGKISENLLSQNVVFNISGEEVLSINEWIHLLKSITNSKSKVTHLPLLLAKAMVNIGWLAHKTNIHPSYLSLMAQDQFFDVSKAKHVLSWEPRYTVKEVLRDTVEFLREEHL